MTITITIDGQDLPAVQDYLKTQCTASVDPVTREPKLTYHYADVEDFITRQVADMVRSIVRLQNEPVQ